MVDILRLPDTVRLFTDEDPTGTAGGEDAALRFDRHDRQLDVYLKADTAAPRFVCLRWDQPATAPVRVLGDCWERSYGDLEWRSLNEHEHHPWYFLATDGEETVGCGVMVQPNSFVSFTYDAGGVTAWFDVRCGGVGVQLDGRELCVGSLVCEHYSGISTFEAARRFCRVMSPAPLLPDHPVYGGNNWYYAYGKSSREDILQDAALIASLTEGLENRPYMVIDAGWSRRTDKVVCGPWLPNDKYGDMAEVAQAIRERDVRPGLWFRPLYDEDATAQHPEWRLSRDGMYLDPSHPGVQAYLTEALRRFKDWGYGLIKHDFSTYDMFGAFGNTLYGTVTRQENWSFHDRKKTGAEIVLDFYRLIRRETEGMVLIGCNTLSHLCAGLVELCRIGDDTSGNVWCRTRSIGVNTLAFRMAQNGAFYMADADCVGILPGRIPWSLNRQWMHLLAYSGTPLFLSCAPGALTAEQAEEIRALMRVASRQANEAEPLDWEYNVTPSRWCIDGEEVTFDWFNADDDPFLRANTSLPY